MAVTHKHHIIPKHAGGTNCSTNIKQLTVKQHAKAHLLLYRQYGREQDLIAYKALSRLIGREEKTRLVQQLAAKIVYQKYGKLGRPFTSTSPTNFALNKKHQKKATLKAKSKQAKHKRKETFQKIKHQQGNKNSQFGWVQCILPTTGVKRRFPKNQIPLGWMTTKNYKKKNRDRTRGCVGKHWYNNGKKNFFLFPREAVVLSVVRGRLMIV